MMGPPGPSAMRRPPVGPLDFKVISSKKASESNGTVARLASPQLEFIRSHSSGRLNFTGEQEYLFTANDLEDLGEIGQGAFGIVSKMRHPQTNIVMAVKRIRSTMDEKEQKQLLMDLDVIMKSDKCDSIVQFYGAVFREGDCWICMELMDTSLEKLYKIVFDRLNETLPEEIIGKIAVATVKALSYLKDNLRIIHRDVKPSNILLDRRGRIKLCDFGIAGQLVDSIARTRDAGCRPYMAPERIDPQKTSIEKGYGVSSDVWSLGITLHEIAIGRFPYPAWNSVFDQLQQVVNGDPPILAPGPTFGLDFCNFVNACLSKDESQRPKYHKLLQSHFIVRYGQANVDVAAYVSRVLDEADNMNQCMNLQYSQHIPMQS